MVTRIVRHIVGMNLDLMLQLWFYINGLNHCNQIGSSRAQSYYCSTLKLNHELNKKKHFRHHQLSDDAKNLTPPWKNTRFLRPLLPSSKYDPNDYKIDIHTYTISTQTEYWHRTLNNEYIYLFTFRHLINYLERY